MFGTPTKNPIEALADAIMEHEGWFPQSRSYRNCNPGNLRALHPTDPQDKDHFRIFTSATAGYAALLDDLTHKFEGKTSTGLTGSSTLLDLLRHYAPASDNNDPTRYATVVSKWLSQTFSVPITGQSTLDQIAALHL